MLKNKDIIQCIVSGIEDYGFFVKTEDGYSGLVHISEMSENFIRNIYDYVTLGEKINAEVIDVDEKNKKLKLSIKNIEYRICANLPEDSEKGFATLKEELPKWIEEAEKEMKKATKQSLVFLSGAQGRT